MITSSPIDSIKPMHMSNNDQAYTTPSDYLSIIKAAANKYHLDAQFIQAVIEQESGYDPQSVSRAGAIGMMQLMPETAKSLGVQNPFDPIENITAGTQYLKSLLDRYHGNKVLALVAYNAGPGAVDTYKGIPPYKETQQYVQKVLAIYSSKSPYL